MTDLKRALGVCYYPEHWPEERWAEDARMMRETGLVWVRIGEFAWSRLEPIPGDFHWDWLDRAIGVLAGEGLKVVLGTPTATPPRWMLDRHPDMLAVDAEGRKRGFGSRRHYCFSHDGYREESVRIARLMGERYGRDDRVTAWQIDNEYGCHDTVVSYSEAARDAFRIWLAERYGTIEALNTAWGNVFWSMEYASFDDIDPPNLTVTEANPSHRLAFARFSSDQVVRYNRAQVEVLRPLTDTPLIHNYMGREVAFDHWAVGADLDIASWDSYPIGFLSDRLDRTEAQRQRFLRQGDPDNQAFHHDLYRSVGKGRWWIMEQQPGPVNWAPHNPAPLPGMARLWAWEAFAHGAEAVCYFRWRQAPFAQEQNHAGLLRPDAAPAPALAEAAQVARELAEAPEAGTGKAQAALIFDYEGCWAWDIQPQGAEFNGFDLALSAYRALRRCGFDIDILPPDAEDLGEYALVLAPGLLTLPKALHTAQGQILFGPRTGTKTEEFAIPTPLGPGIPGLDVAITLTESLPPSERIALDGGGHIHRWFEHIDGTADAGWVTVAGQPVLASTGHRHYLAGWPDEETFYRMVAELAESAGLEPMDLPDGLRVRRTDTHLFVFNYAPDALDWQGTVIPPAGVHREEL
ncbi:beta-galactosidase [Aestuariibius sp. 2305UL40-4]|uniref:beta-galactosidase n=1 Tax=Aestuariibius violaceus TaxID=3234132 RepID=UPI00345EA3AA